MAKVQFTKYDYLIVGAGLFGSVFAEQMNSYGKKVLVVERRNRRGGNIYDEYKYGIPVQKYGAHIFHTNNEAIWEYVKQFMDFVPYKHNVMVRNGSKMYTLPFNLHTFHEIYGIQTPAELEGWIARHKGEQGKRYENLEQKAICSVGRSMYEKLIKGYTEKQWGRKCSELPPEILGRIPIRTSLDTDYFDDEFEAMPVDGYTQMIESMLGETEVRTGVNFNGVNDPLMKIAKRVVYTGSIDEFFNYRLGVLEYRSIEFKEFEFGVKDYQGAPVINNASSDVPYTRSIEHKHFLGETPSDSHTIVTYEYPCEWKPGKERYYPINNEKNMGLLKKYQKLAKEEAPNVLFGGRLGMYKYLDMDETIEAALDMAYEELEGGENVDE